MVPGREAAGRIAQALIYGDNGQEAPKMTTTTSIEFMTPAAAEALLQENLGSNRRLRPGIVNSYAADMASGRWQSNGETVKVSAEGVLLDGQHRLHAVIKSGACVPMMVVRGLPADSFRTIDTGYRRTGAQVMAMDGVENSSIVNSACRWAHMLTGSQSVGSKGMVTTQQVFEAYARHPLIQHYADRHASDKGLLISACVGVLALACEKYGRERVDEFLGMLNSGVGLQAKQPAYELREKLIKDKRSASKYSQETIVALFIKALTAHMQGRGIGVLRWSPGKEEFPSL